jgi:beta-lactam-binding protein with PASTA domain
MTQAQAQTLLNQRGLLVSITVHPQTQPRPDSIVLAQDPVAGTTVPGGSTITLIVSG